MLLCRHRPHRSTLRTRRRHTRQPSPVIPALGTSAAPGAQPPTDGEEAQRESENRPHEGGVEDGVDCEAAEDGVGGDVAVADLEPSACAQECWRLNAPLDDRRLWR